MKYILSALFSIIVFSLSGQVLAQQQDGVTASDLQPQIGGSTIQQNRQSQQTSPVTDNAGASTLQNLPNQEIAVEGQAQPVPDEIESSPRWIALFVLFFALLFAPAALFVRDMNKKEQLDNKPKAKPAKQPAKSTKKEPVVSIPKDTEPEPVVKNEPVAAPEEEPVLEEVSEEDKAIAKSKKKKKKSTNKVKRGKKRK